MSKQNLARIALVVLTVVYNFFFWEEKLGVNILIFTVLVFTALYFINKESFKKLNVIISCLGTFLLACFIVYNNSNFTKFIYFFSFTAAAGFIHQKELKALSSAMLTFFLSNLALPYNILEELKFAFGRYKHITAVLRFTKLVILPLLVLVVFYAIYINANPIFAQASSEFWSYTDNFFQYIFENFPISRFIFILFGIGLLMGILYNRNIGLMVKLEAKLKDYLVRKDPGLFLPSLRLYKNAMALVNEYKTGIILLVLVNALILILNYIDIRYYWFGFEYYKGFDLKQFVHEGTYLLIYSILLSMAILLYLFRGKLNFYSKNNTLKYLAYLWIFQNAVMAISVGVRNYYYIYYSHSLAYKRIGLIIFLTLVFIGLITLYFKIKNRTTFYNLFKVNSWAAYAVLLIAAGFNWGLIIAEFNFTNPDKDSIDYDFMVSLSDSAIPVLDSNRELLEDRYVPGVWLNRTGDKALNMLNQRITEFKEEQEGYTWLSWNYADEQVKNYLSSKK
jgi:hypothetical protein